MLRVRSLPRYHPVPLALALSLLPAGAVAARAFWRTDSGELKASLFDDAMISMSYARTFAEGHGLVWHPGAPRVEGITNLSWTLVMSLLHRLGLGPVGVVVVVMALGLGCVWLTAAIAVRLARSFRPADRTSSFFVAAVVALNFPLLFWAVRGMEVGLVTMLALLACLLTWELAARHCPRRCAALAVVVVVGIATRTDFAVVPLALGGWAMLSPAARRLRILVPLAVGTVTSLAGTTLFRLWYYDRPVPNTYYLKLEGVSLFDRLSRGLTVDAVIAAAYLVPPLVLVALGWRHLEGRERSLGRLLLVVAAAHVAYSTYAGGDAWEMFLLPNRYLTPAVVCLYLLAALVTTRTFMRPGTVADGSSTSAVAAPPTVASVPPTATTPTTPNAPAPANATATATATALEPTRSPSATGPALAALAVGPLVTVAASRAVDEFAPMQHPTFFYLPALALAGAGVAGAYLLTTRAGTTSRLAAMAPLLLLGTLLGTLLFRTPQVLAEDGNRFSVLGDQLAQVTTADATVAVTGAGGSQYHSRRAAVDLLGKNDRVIAEGGQRADWFMPGHDKWNLEHSLVRLRPDVIAQAAVPGGIPADYLDSLGYVPVTLAEGGFTAAIEHSGRKVVYVREDSPRILWDRLTPVR